MGAGARGRGLSSATADRLTGDRSGDLSIAAPWRRRQRERTRREHRREMSSRTDVVTGETETETGIRGKKMEKEARRIWGVIATREIDVRKEGGEEKKGTDRQRNGGLSDSKYSKTPC